VGLPIAAKYAQAAKLWHRAMQGRFEWHERLANADQPAAGCQFPMDSAGGEVSFLIRNSCLIL
jgi:hypothetical protein